MIGPKAVAILLGSALGSDDCEIGLQRVVRPRFEGQRVAAGFAAFDGDRLALAAFRWAGGTRSFVNVERSVGEQWVLQDRVNRDCVDPLGLAGPFLAFSDGLDLRIYQDPGDGTGHHLIQKFDGHVRGYRVDEFRGPVVFHPDGRRLIFREHHYDTGGGTNPVRSFVHVLEYDEDLGGFTDAVVWDPHHERYDKSFGVALDWWRNWLVIGDPHYGELYFFDPPTWNECFLESERYQFGRAFAIEESWLAVSSSNEVTVFRRVEGDTPCEEWQEHTILTSDTRADFGAAMAFWGPDELLVAAPKEEVDGVAEAGVVHVYRYEDDRWTRIRTIEDPSPQHFGHFGQSLASTAEWFTVKQHHASVEDSETLLFGRGLGFAAVDESVPAGGSITFHVGLGGEGELALIAFLGADAVLDFVTLDRGPFAANGWRTKDFDTPLSVAGSELFFQAFGIDECGCVRSSSRISVRVE